MSTSPGIFDHPQIPNDMWGNADDVSFQPLREGQKYYKIGTCQYKDCKEPVQMNQRQWFIIRRNEGSLSDQVSI
jgi:hypothetical protein